MHSRQRSASSPAAIAGLRRQPSNLQGRAFAAPRDQSIDRQTRGAKTDIDNLRNCTGLITSQVQESTPRRRTQENGQQHELSPSGITRDTIGLRQRHSRISITTLLQRKPPLNGPARILMERILSPAREPLRWMQSTESLQPKKSFDTARLKHGPGTSTRNKGPYNFTVVQHRIEPHTLGLSTNPQMHAEGVPDPIARPGTGLSFRDKMDRNRFEFKAVRRKASGSIKDRGANLWDQVRSRGKEREGVDMMC